MIGPPRPLILSVFAAAQVGEGRGACALLET
jgi:hypothetical protein